MTTAAHVKELARLLDLDHPPVAVTFHEHAPPEQLRSRPAPEPAGCCFWAKAEHHRLRTTAADLANAPTVATLQPRSPTSPSTKPRTPTSCSCG